MPDQPVAIVTGAGSGVGRGVCMQLAQAGWRLALVGRTAKTLRDTAEQIDPTAGDRTLVMQADMGDDLSPRLIPPKVMERFGRIDAVVNNAAVLIAGPIETADVIALQQTFAANAIGPALLVNAVWPTFVKQHSGCVVNVSSMATVDPFPGLGVYAASKAALESFVRAYAKEGGTHNIRAFAIAPGAIDTAMLRGTFSEQVLPKSKTLSPDDVATVIVACITGKRDADIGKTILLPSP